MYKGLACSCSWIISWGTMIYAVLFLQMVGKVPHLALLYVMNVFWPLQGLFNLAIYMHPKILKAKASARENLTWWQAFVKAFWSKGLDKKKMGGRRGPRMTAGTGPNGGDRTTKQNEDLMNTMA